MLTKEICDTIAKFLTKRDINLSESDFAQLENYIRQIAYKHANIQSIAEQEITDNRNHLQNLIEMVGDGITLSDPRGYFEIFNSKMKEITGYSKDEANRASDFMKLIYPDSLSYQKAVNTLNKLTEDEGHRESETRIVTKNDDKKTLIVSSNIIRYSGENYYLSIYHDITIRKKAENRLKIAIKEAEKASKLKSEFLANMSHEIRTPMNAIIGFGEILKDKLTAHPEYIEFIDGINTAGKSLLELITDILDLSKIEAGRLEIQNEPVNLRAIINDIKRVFLIKATSKGLDFIINIDPSLPEILELDETRLRQILFNLIGNAIKFTFSGFIEISIHSINPTYQYTGIQINVRDSGVGIQENQQKRIFEPFRQKIGQRTKKYGGTGLGLSITKRLIEMMNGTVKLYSKIDEGANFTICIPNVRICREETLNPKKRKENKPEITFSGEKLLLVDDIFSNRRVITAYLAKNNLTIIEAENGAEALEKMKSTIPDIIILDMLMPVMDGYQTIECIKNDDRLKNIPIISMTAEIQKEQVDIIKKKTDAYISKPVLKANLIETICKLLPYKKEESPAISKSSDIYKLIEELKCYISKQNNPTALKPVFYQKLQPAYNKVIYESSMSSIKALSKIICNIGAEYNCNNLTRIGHEIQKNAKTYNIEAINKLLSIIPEIIAIVNNKA